MVQVGIVHDAWMNLDGVLALRNMPSEQEVGSVWSLVPLFYCAHVLVLPALKYSLV
jgi:hypothetical protein